MRSHWSTLIRLLADERNERIVVLEPAGLSLPAGVAAMDAIPDSLMLAALLARASLVIAPDTGTLHLADLLGVPTIGLYGPTAPDACCLPNSQRRALCHAEMTCHPCHDAVCPERSCLRALTPAEVVFAVQDSLREAVPA